MVEPAPMESDRQAAPIVPLPAELRPDASGVAAVVELAVAELAVAELAVAELAAGQLAAVEHRPCCKPNKWRRPTQSKTVGTSIHHDS